MLKACKKWPVRDGPQHNTVHSRNKCAAISDGRTAVRAWYTLQWSGGTDRSVSRVRHCGVFKGYSRVLKGYSRAVLGRTAAYATAGAVGVWVRRIHVRLISQCFTLAVGSSTPVTAVKTTAVHLRIIALPAGSRRTATCRASWPAMCRRNPAARVANAYHEALSARHMHFDVVAFGIFNAGAAIAPPVSPSPRARCTSACCVVCFGLPLCCATSLSATRAGYGPNNFAPFEAEFAKWAIPQ